MYVKVSKARILKHFEMTAGLKVQVQGFNKSANIQYKILTYLDLFGKLLFFYLIYIKEFFQTTLKNVPV